MDLQKDFHKYNLIIGWGVFLIALITYGLSVEPTVSFWDCGEYIATSAKLEVGHPPGAPFFQMVGAFFASFSPSPEMTALFVNFISVFSSAFTILFLYFIIVNFTKKIALSQKETLSNAQVITLYVPWLIPSPIAFGSMLRRQRCMRWRCFSCRLCSG